MIAENGIEKSHCSGRKTSELRWEAGDLEKGQLADKGTQRVKMRRTLTMAETKLLIKTKERHWHLKGTNLST